jgi:hypothetical protein
MVHRMLRVPLLYKLAGANLIIVLAAWGAGYVAYRLGRGMAVIPVMTIALAIGLAVNCRWCR